MNYKIFSFVIVSLFTVTAGCAVPSKPASQEISKQNLPSAPVKAKVSQPIPVTLRTGATVFMKRGEEESGRVVKIDEKAQKLWIQRSGEKQHIPLSKIKKIVFGESVVDYPSKSKGRFANGRRQAKGSQKICSDIPMKAFRLLDPNQGKAEVNLESVVSPDKLNCIRSVMVGDGKNELEFLVDEMQFDVQKKTMTIAGTPYELVIGEWKY